MIIEIHGAGFENKGAELMLRATVAELRARMSDLELVIDPGYGSFLERSKLGLKQFFPQRSNIGTKNWKRRFTIQKLLSFSLNSYGCVSLKSIDALIDISGFTFSDRWNPRPTEDMAILTKYYSGCPRRKVLSGWAARSQ